MSSIAIAVLKDKEAGTFLIRDSNSFQGAYGLALKVATPPPNANVTGSKGIHHKYLHIKYSLLVMGSNPHCVKTVMYCLLCLWQELHKSLIKCLLTTAVLKLNETADW